MTLPIDTRQAEWVALFLSGKSIEQVAEQCGVTQQRVQQALRAALRNSVGKA